MKIFVKPNTGTEYDGRVIEVPWVGISPNSLAVYGALNQPPITIVPVGVHWIADVPIEVWGREQEIQA